MASNTNEIQGSSLLHEVSEDEGVTWLTIVCAKNAKIGSKANITNETTKCGPIPGIGVPDWTMDGDGFTNTAPTANQASTNHLMNWITHTKKVWFRVQSPPHDTVQIGEDYYRAGEGYFSTVNEDISEGSAAKFDWSFGGVGPLATVKLLGIYTQPVTPVSIAVGSTISLSVEAQGGTPPYTYQWKKGGVNISGATNPYYVKGNAQVGDSATYTVVITDAVAGTVTSANSVVTVS